MKKLAWTLGVCAQGLLLGSLLFLAILRLLIVATGARIFRYEGF